MVRMRIVGRALASATSLALMVALGASPPATAAVPAIADNVFVIAGANADAWAPAILEPLDPWSNSGPLVPLINAHYYDCAGCEVSVIGYPRSAGPLFGPGAPFADESIAIGAARVVADVRGASGPSVISALSLGSMTADAAQHELDADPLLGPARSDLTFIVAGDPSRVTPLTTGIGSFLPAGMRVPVLGWTVTRPPAESIYDTVVVVGEYEWAADFPDRPWNLLADLNALVGFNYSHSEAALTNPADVPPQNIVTTTNGKGATTTTYLIPSPEVPLLKPFEKVLAPSVLAAANKVLKPIVDRGYSRYDDVTGNTAPYLKPGTGLPSLVRPTATPTPPAGASATALTPKSSVQQRGKTAHNGSSRSQQKDGRGSPGR